MAEAWVVWSVLAFWPFLVFLGPDGKDNHNGAGQDTFALQESDPVHASMVRLFASFVKTVKICEKSSPTLQPRHWTSSEEGNFCI